MSQLQFRSDDSPDKWKEGFGDGSDGSSYSVPANEGCSGTSGTKTLTLAAAGSFANDDLILIHQTRGTGAGTWQLNKIVSGATTTTLTLKYDLTNTYTDSGANQAQIIEMKSYDGMTTGAITAPTWNGSKGGILAWFDKGTTTVDNTLTLTGKGHAGGIKGDSGGAGYQGDSSTGAGAINTTTANGAGGGGGKSGTGNLGSHPGGGGGGGGNGAAGANGSDASYTGDGGGVKGTGGAVDGGASLVDMVMGAGGGAGGDGYSQCSGNYWAGGFIGTAGGGMSFIFAKNIVITGAITLGSSNSANSNGNAGVGGTGSGGSCLLKCETATLGTAKITANAGSSGSSPGRCSSTGGAGGAGSVGRIHIDYSDSFTGTTNPTIDSTLDTTIKPFGSFTPRVMIF